MRVGRHSPELFSGMIILVMVIPVLAALLATVSTSLGYAPWSSGDQLTTAHFQSFLFAPGIAKSMLATLISGVLATVVSFLLAFMTFSVTAAWLERKSVVGLLAVFLSIPHAALAIGLAFLLAPSGFIMRLVAQAISVTTPYDQSLINDPYGLSLALGLIVKEAPFFYVILASNVAHLRLQEQLKLGRSLGYHSTVVWLFLILPQVWKPMRFPFLIVLAYSMSVVDVAAILGPTNPPTMAMFITRLFSNPDLANWYPAAAGSLLLMCLVGLTYAALLLSAKLLGTISKHLLVRKVRFRGVPEITTWTAGLTLSLASFGLFSLLLMLIWSFSWRWSFPAVFPERLTLRTWENLTSSFTEAIVNSTIIGLSAAGVSLTIAIAWLQLAASKKSRILHLAEKSILLPLVIPQVAFTFGLNLVFLQLPTQNFKLLVIYSHLLIVFPYIYLALAQTWRNLDPRLDRIGASLGLGQTARLFKLKLPILFGPIATAFALGFAVSFAQYLPTLIVGAGRVPTLTTEALALASGADRRISGAYAVTQAILPVMVYMLCLMAPTLIYRNRRDLSLKALV